LQLEPAPVLLQHFQLLPQNQKGSQQSEGHHGIALALQQGRGLWAALELTSESQQFGPIWLKAL
jgi:hypothetical protein